VRRGSLVVSMVIPDAAEGGDPARAAAVAGRRVGPAITRNRVKRRLRELLRPRLAELPSGSLVVIRALPGSEEASYAQLGAWLDAGIRGCVSRAGPVHV
jgi:ribonuclease P protein component